MKNSHRCDNFYPPRRIYPNIKIKKVEENNRGNTQQNIQNGQGVQGQQNSPQGASFGTQNTGGKVIGNDTAAVGSGGVVSLKGGQTQREINEQRKIEELKSRAVKLERKLTPREKELERMHKEAIKPVSLASNFQDTRYKTQTSSKTQDSRDNTQDTSIREVPYKMANSLQETTYNEKKNSNAVNFEVDTKRQEELVENLINPVEKVKTIKQPIVKQEVIKPVVPKPTIKKKVVKQVKKEEKNISLDSSKERQIKKADKEEAKRRMVISPTGQISYVDSQKTENSTIKDDKKSATENNTSKDNDSKTSISSNVVNLKPEEKSTIEKDAGVASTMVESKNITKTPSIPKKPETPWEEKKVDLKDLSQEKRLDLQATPSMASVNFNMDDDSNKEMVEWFDKYNELPVNIKLGLGSSEVRQKIKELAAKNNLMKEGPLGEISRIIRDVYVRLIKAEDIKKRLSTILKLEENISASVIKEIGNIVGTVKEVGNKKSNEYFDKLSLKEALEKYPNISTEEITRGNIIDKKTGKYIEPTVQNWMNDYINQMGSGQHTNLERGRYLSDSPNTKNLDKDDKKVIEKLIKSHDENSKLIIDKEEKVVMWLIHEDESSLGINSDKNKRVINKFKIEEAQTVDHEKKDPLVKEKNTLVNDKLKIKQTETGLGLENHKMKASPDKGVNSKIKKDLEKETGDSIINSVRSGVDSLGDVNGRDEGLLDLSSEIPIKK